jgi:predicted ester cyclase
MSDVTTAPVLEVARAFFDACETGKGWEVCGQFCTPDASFSAQAEPLEDVHTLEQYTDWMKGLLTILPDGRYELNSFAADGERNNVVAYGVFLGTHTGEGGPVPPTGKSVKADYVYVMDFQGDRIHHRTKVWHSGISLEATGLGLTPFITSRAERTRPGRCSSDVGAVAWVSRASVAWRVN